MKKIFLVLVPNRQRATMLNILHENVIDGSIIITDGYPSYVGSLADFGSRHIVCPHSEGFVASNNDHNNLIENLWSHLKDEYRIRRGVRVFRMFDFIYEFYLGKNILSYPSVHDIYLMKS